MILFSIGYLTGQFLLWMIVIGSLYYFIKRRRISFLQAIFNRQVFGITFILYFLAVVIGMNLSSQQDSSHVYPEKAVKPFIAGCLDGMKEKIDSKVAGKICSCSMTKLQNKYTYSEFKKLSLTMQNKAMPPELKDVYTSCIPKQLQ
jgi:hypothetical protein